MAEQTLEQRLALLEQNIKRLEGMAQTVQNKLNYANNKQQQQQQQQKQQQNKNSQQKGDNATAAAATSAKAKPAKPQAAAAKPAYKYDAAVVSSRYQHDKELPPVMMCDPTINYQNAVTNTQEDVDKAFNDNEKFFRKFAREQNLHSAVFYRAPGDYYDWSLQKRRDLLGASSVHYLCKSMLMKNSKCEHENYDNKLDSKYYFCVIQYSARLHNEKVAHSIRRLHPQETRKPLKNYNFRWTEPEVSLAMTGHPHNGVTPLACKTKIPIIISHKIADLPAGYFWFGAGEVDLKIRMSVAEFVSHFADNIIIDDITYDEPAHDDNGPIGGEKAAE